MARVPPEVAPISKTLLLLSLCQASLPVGPKWLACSWWFLHEIRCVGGFFRGIFLRGALCTWLASFFLRLEMRAGLCLDSICHAALYLPEIRPWSRSLMPHWPIQRAEA